MQLSINNIGKHYNSQWLFRNIDFNLQTGDSIAILGKNGTGKSTLLQIVSGLIQSSEGTVKIDGKLFDQPHLFFNITSPMLTLPLEFNIEEIYAYQLSIGKSTLPLKSFIEQSNFTEKEAKRPLRYFSSGMLQRLKTAFCLFNTGYVKLLDEPLSNMDKEGEKWYLNCIENIGKKHIIVVASNYDAEYQFTTKNINL